MTRIRTFQDFRVEDTSGLPAGSPIVVTTRVAGDVLVLAVTPADSPGETLDEAVWRKVAQHLADTT